MEQQRDHSEEDSKSVNEPSGRPPDEGLAHDPAMDDGDEANIPPESEADPQARA